MFVLVGRFVLTVGCFGPLTDALDVLLDYLGHFVLPIVKEEMASGLWLLFQQQSQYLIGENAIRLHNLLLLPLLLVVYDINNPIVPVALRDILIELPGDGAFLATGLLLAIGF